MKKQQLRRDLRAAVEKAERLEAELNMTRKLLEEKEAYAEYETACMLNRIKGLVERDVLLCAVNNDQNVRDDSSSISVGAHHDDGDITERALRYCITGTRTERKQTESLL